MHDMRSNNLTISDSPKISPDIEPIYVAQTHEPEHIEGSDAPRLWFQKQIAEAKGEGATFPRFHRRTEEPAGLLFECWTERPLNCGEPRWSFAAHGEDVGKDANEE